MAEVTQLLHEELERLSPRDEIDVADWSDVLRRARVAGRAHAVPRRTARKRYAIALVGAVAVVAVAAPAFALSPTVRSWVGLRSTPVFAESRLLVSAPVGNGAVVRLWVAPSDNGGECRFKTIGPAGEAAPPDDMNGGGVCGGGSLLDHVPDHLPIVLGISAARRPLEHPGAGAWVPPVIHGWIDPDRGAATVELRWNGGASPIAFENDHFLGASEALYEPPAAHFPFYVVAYDGEGREVVRKEIPRDWLYLD